MSCDLIWFDCFEDLWSTIINLINVQYKFFYMVIIFYNNQTLIVFFVEFMWRDYVNHNSSKILLVILSIYLLIFIEVN